MVNYGEIMSVFSWVVLRNALSCVTPRYHAISILLPCHYCAVKYNSFFFPSVFYCVLYSYTVVLKVICGACESELLFHSVSTTGLLVPCTSVSPCNNNKPPRVAHLN